MFLSQSRRGRNGAGGVGGSRAVGGQRGQAVFHCRTEGQ